MDGGFIARLAAAGGRAASMVGMNHDGGMHHGGMPMDAEHRAATGDRLPRYRVERLGGDPDLGHPQRVRLVAPAGLAMAAGRP